MLPRNIILVRHGYSTMNAVVELDKNEYSGKGWNWNPTPEEILEIREEHDSVHRLHPMGINQARLANHTLKHLFPQGFDKVYVSPYQRTIETAAHALRGYEAQNIHLDSRIVERDWGDYGRIPRKEAELVHPHIKKHRDAAPLYTRLPGGQSLNDLEPNVRSMLSTLHRQQEEHKAETVLLVSHGEYMTVFLKVITANAYPDLKFGNCDVVQIQTENKKKKLRILPPGTTPAPEAFWENVVFESKKYTAKDLFSLLH